MNTEHHFIAFLFTSDRISLDLTPFLSFFFLFKFPLFRERPSLFYCGILIWDRLWGRLSEAQRKINYKYSEE